MKVEFVHCTQDAEQLIVRMARVSNEANQDNWETGPKLLRYLLKHKHYSPFEMVSMCVRIETERDIAAQIIRHRSFSFQERSTRYAEAPTPAVPQLRRQDKKNRQNSIDDLATATKVELLDRIGAIYGETARLYEDMLSAGVAKETARRILPLSTRTTLYMHGTARSWLHYLQVRCHEDTQLEHRQVAQACYEVFAKQFPTIAELVFNA